MFILSSRSKNLCYKKRKDYTYEHINLQQLPKQYIHGLHYRSGNTGKEEDYVTVQLKQRKSDPDIYSGTKKRKQMQYTFAVNFGTLSSSRYREKRNREKI